MSKLSYICDMEDILTKIQQIVEERFGVVFAVIANPGRYQEVSDARTAYIYAVYNTITEKGYRLMNGVALGKHLNCTSRSIYYHLAKYEDLKQMWVMKATLSLFEDELKKNIEGWQDHQRHTISK